MACAPYHADRTSPLNRLSIYMTTSSGGTAASGFPERPIVPWLLRRLNQRYRDATGTRLAGAGFQDLPQRGYWALMALAAGATDASQLVSEMRITKQAVSKLVDVLVASGFVDRRTNPIDRRRTELTLTTKGGRAVAVIEQAVRATEEELVGKVGATPFGEFVRMLAQLGDEEV